jgi:hypothetical protein
MYLYRQHMHLQLSQASVLVDVYRFFNPCRPIATCLGEL